MTGVAYLLLFVVAAGGIIVGQGVLVRAFIDPEFGGGDCCGVWECTAEAVFTRADGSDPRCMTHQEAGR